MDHAEELLELLCEDARHSTADLARLTGLNAEEVEESIAELEDDGVIQGYTTIVDWDAVGDERVRAHVELNVTLDRETSRRPWTSGKPASRSATSR